MRYLFGLPSGRGSRGLRAALVDRLSGPRAPGAAVWAVRWDWPDGVHEFIGPARDTAAAVALRQEQIGKWRRIAYRPRLSIATISSNDFWLHAYHRPGCKSPDCPVAGLVVPA
jgi:hypothetical protein